MKIDKCGNDVFGIISDDGLGDVAETEWTKLVTYVQVSDITALIAELQSASAEDRARFLGLLSLLEAALTS